MDCLLSMIGFINKMDRSFRHCIGPKEEQFEQLNPLASRDSPLTSKIICPWTYNRGAVGFSWSGNQRVNSTYAGSHHVYIFTIKPHFGVKFHWHQNKVCWSKAKYSNNRRTGGVILKLWKPLSLSLCFWACPGKWGTLVHCADFLEKWLSQYHLWLLLEVFCAVHTD